VILVAHGAALEKPADAQYILDNTTGHGFWTGSSTERLPIEVAVSKAAKDFVETLGGKALIIDIGVVGEAGIKADISRADVIARGGGNLEGR